MSCFNLPTVSVVICTYNRSPLLSQALQSLCEQALDPSKYEIIIVDNNSSDDTREVAEDFARRHPQFRYCFEPRQGLSHARNRGWREARGAYIAYMDDDCRLPAEWLVVAMEVIERRSPGVFGGPYYAFYDGPKPSWFKDSYGSLDLGSQARVLAEEEFLHGGNIFFRRSLLEAVGGFDVGLGMKGDRIAYGEEIALIGRVRSVMPKEGVYYEPRLYLHHLVRAHKMTMRWIIYQRFSLGRHSSRLLLGKLPENPTLISLLGKAGSRALLLSGDLLYGIFLRDRARYPYFQNYLCEHTSRYLRALGTYFEQFQSLRHSHTRGRVVSSMRG